MEISNKKGELFFKGEFVLDNIEDVKEQLILLSSKIKTKEVKLNLIDVVEIDSAGIQLILSFCKTLKKDGIAYSITKVNDDISNILEISGLGRFMNLV